MARPGSWDLSLDGDADLADGQETVALQRLRADGSWASPVMCRAVRESADRRKVNLSEMAELVWHLLSAAQVGPEGVRPGDRIRDDSGVEWEATSATLAGASDQWRVPCLRVAGVPTEV